jgi:hypothetical protein
MLNALTFSKLGLFSILGSTAQDSSEAWQTGFQDAATPYGRNHQPTS